MSAAAATTTQRKRRRRAPMTTRVEDERRREELGERFLKQMGEMLASTRADFVPRPEYEARTKKHEDILERVEEVMDKLTSNVHTFHESVPTLYENRENAVREYGEMHTAIAKLETAFDAFRARQYGSRFEDMQGRYGGDERVERGWRQNAQQSSTQMLTWVIGGGYILFSTAAMIILAMRH